MRTSSSNLESWEPSQHSLIDTGKPRKTCSEVEFNILWSCLHDNYKTSAADKVLSFNFMLHELA